MYDAGSNLTFFTEETEGNEDGTYLIVSVFEMDLTMFNSVVQVSTSTPGVTHTVTYEDGNAVIRFFTSTGEEVFDLDDLENVTVVVF